MKKNKDFIKVRKQSYNKNFVRWLTSQYGWVVLLLTHKNTQPYWLINCLIRYIYLPNKKIVLYVRSDWTIKSRYSPLFTFYHPCVMVRTLFSRNKVFFTILEHLKLKFSNLFADLANTKTIIPLTVSDQRWIFTSPLHDSVLKYPPLVTSTSGDNCISCPSL